MPSSSRHRKHFTTVASPANRDVEQGQSDQNRVTVPRGCAGFLRKSELVSIGDRSNSEGVWSWCRRNNVPNALRFSITVDDLLYRRKVLAIRSTAAVPDASGSIRRAGSERTRSEQVSRVPVWMIPPRTTASGLAHCVGSLRCLQSDDTTLLAPE